MRTAATVLPFLLFIASGSDHRHVKQQRRSSDYISEQAIDQRRDAIRVFEFDKVDETHACNLIRCSEDDICALLDNVALCIERHKAKRIIMDVTDAERPSGVVDNYGETPTRRAKHGWKARSHRNLQELSNKIGRKHVENYDQPCTDQQLINVEYLLNSWFSVLHKENADTVPLPKHSLRCRPDVGWMFTQLDGDRNGQLVRDELYALDHEKYKNCIHHFLDQCDLNQDGQLSVDEWCDCFQWAGKEREEPPCHAARRLIDPHTLGSFIPRCDPEGFYRPQQCHGLQCWCTDKWGREFDHSRTSGHADCGQYAEQEVDDDGDEQSLLLR